MTIGIDGNEANQKVKVGSGVYAYNLLKQIYMQAQSAPASPGTGRAKLKCQIYLKDNPISELPSPTDYWEYKIIKPAKLWTQLGLPIHLWKEKILGKVPDVFFTPTHYAPRFCPVPSVITIFDLSFIRFPEMFLKKDLYQLTNWTDYSVRQAKKIITISEFSKKEIMDYYKIPEDKIVIAYPGYDKKKFKVQSSPASPGTGRAKFKVNEVLKKYKIDMPYILYVGTIQPRKNLVRLIEAFAKLGDKNMKLVICGMIKEGRGGWMNENIKNQKSPASPGTGRAKIKNDVILTGYVSDEELPYLISGSKALVLPSLYEGFGIPVIEAMACGIPTVVSNGSSLAEIAGNATVLVDPYDINSVLIGLKEACYNEARRSDLIRKGIKQVEQFDWEKSAKIILETLLSLK